MLLGLSDAITLEVTQTVVSPFKSKKTNFSKCHIKQMLLLTEITSFLKKLKNVFPLYKALIAYL